MAFTFFIYRWLLAPLAWVLLQIFSPLVGGKLRAFVRLKNAAEFRVGGDEERIRVARPFWIHAASGEIEYARPVLRELKKRFPEVPVVVTYSSPSAVRLLEKLPDVDAWGPAPWEFRRSVRRFHARFRPRALLIARTDAWPVLVDETKRQEVPALLFAATFADDSSRLRGPGRWLTLRTLKLLDAAQVVSEADRRAVGASVSTEVRGDTRFDQVFHRLSQAQPLTETLRPRRGPVFVAGSTWPEDEAVLVPAFARAPAEWRFLIAPHETDEAHLARLEADLARVGLSSQRYTRGGTWDQRVLLIDRVGILAELYAWGDLAFVGGSFRRQIHSVMEPLAAGLRVLVGPFHRNNREAIAFQGLLVDDLPCVREVTNAAEVGAALADPRLRSGRDGVRELVRSQAGATSSVLDWCARLTVGRG